MKKLIIIIAFAAAAFTGLQAQQIPLYSQYWYHPYLYNPALTGSTGSPQLFFIYRRQWAGFDQAPETRAATFDMPVMSNKAGFGGYVFNDQSSIFRRWGGSFTYAYHINFAENHRLSLGLSAGAQSVRINYNDVFVIDPTDEVITNGIQRNSYFEAGFGINYMLKDWSLGLSVPSLFGTDLKYLSQNGRAGYETARHYVAQTSYKLRLAQDKFTIQPTVMFRTTESLNFQLDAGASFMYKDWVWINGMYRYDYAVSVGGGFKVHNMITIGYSYDLPINNLNGYTTGSHEILLGITFGKKKKGDEANQELVDKLAEVTAKNDSVLSELLGKVDSLGGEMDSLKGVLANGLEVEGEGGAADQAQLDSLNKRVTDLEQQLQNKLDSLQKQVNKTADKVNDQNEERTRIVEENDLEYKRGAVLGNYFMVVGSFRIEQNSYNFQEQLTKEGFKAGVVYDKKRKWYYVYLSQPDNWEKGLEQLFKLREENERFHDAWIHIMEKSFK